MAAYALLAAALAAPSAEALTLSDSAAQELQRQQARERDLRQRLEPRPDVRLPQAAPTPVEPLPGDETPCFPIHRIRLDDASGLFGWALAVANMPDDGSSRCLGSGGINALMARIQNAIIARGYVTTRILAEPQDLTRGTLTLKVVPGRVRAIRFADGTSPRASTWNAVPINAGEVLNLRAIEQALENFKRLPTAEADIEIVPGEALGESDLVISWKQAFPLRITLAANDGGSESTGKYQGSFTLSGDNLLGLNDLFYATLSRDLGGGQPGKRGTRGQTVHYSVPFDFWLLGLTASTNRHYQNVAGASQSYLYSGTSENYDVKLSRLVYRDASNKTSLFLKTYLNKSANFIDDAEVEVQRRRMAGWEAGVGHHAYIGAATLDSTLAWRRGTGAYAAMNAPEEDFGEGTARPRIVTADATLALPFSLAGQKLRYNGQWRTQWNRSPLVPQDRFSIGGRYTVRGFDGESVLMAERGFLLRNDLSWALGESGQEFYVGVDHGRVGGRSADMLVGRSLTGSVIGLRGAWRGATYDLFAGRPLSKPQAFRTDHTVTGFSITFNY